MTGALEDRDLELSERQPPGGVHLEPSPRRVRVVFAGQVVADSTRVMLMLEPRHLPVYYFPRADVRTDWLAPTDRRTDAPGKGEASYWTLKVGARSSENAAWAYLEPVAERPELKEYIAFYWDKVDHWFEEDDEVFVHPRDPYKRVDVLNSSRHVRIVVAGETVAETRRPRLLFETGLPTRYYIPKLDVRMDLLIPSDKRTRCPYKGEAVYWSVKVGDTVEQDLVWSYPAPIPECPKIENLLAFFNEHVDAIYVDGEKAPVPKTPWSRPAR
jgi:uncharacterized protein (DUF427 family)